MATTRGTSRENRELRLRRWARADSEGPCTHTKELRLGPLGHCSPHHVMKDQLLETTTHLGDILPLVHLSSWTGNIGRQTALGVDLLQPTASLFQRRGGGSVFVEGVYRACVTSAWWTGGRVSQAAGTTVRKLSRESGKWMESLARGTRRSWPWGTRLQSVWQHSVPKWQGVALFPRLGGPSCQPRGNPRLGVHSKGGKLTPEDFPQI